MNAPSPSAPDEGSGKQSPWREIFGDYGPVEGRRFRAGDHVWTVVAITPEYLDKLDLRHDALLPRLAKGWLAFECGAERRRLAPIPEGWEQMTAEELSELCASAKPSRRPSKP